MVYRPNTKHINIRYGGSLPTQPKEAANDLVGIQSNGYIQMDNSIKINGGSVLMSNSSKLVNKNVINPRIKSKNKDVLVRTVF